MKLKTKHKAVALVLIAATFTASIWLSPWAFDRWAETNKWMQLPIVATEALVFVATFVGVFLVCSWNDFNE